MKAYVSLELSLQVILVIIDDSLIGNRDKVLLSFFIGEIVHPIKDVIVESNRPLQFKGTGFP